MPATLFLVIHCPETTCPVKGLLFDFPSFVFEEAEMSYKGKSKNDCCAREYYSHFSC